MAPTAREAVATATSEEHPQHPSCPPEFTPNNFHKFRPTKIMPHADEGDPLHGQCALPNNSISLFFF